MTDVNADARDSPGLWRAIAVRGLQILLVFLLQAALVFGAAGRLDWFWAWLYLGIYAATVAMNATLLLRRSPEVVAERGRPGEAPRWDSYISGLMGLAQYIALPLVAGLDDRFVWTGPIAPAWNIAGVCLFAAGLALFSWAMLSNAFFSTAARLQPERDQTVCRAGPYRFVRHPGYAGLVLQAVGVPLLLDSFWALLPGAIAIMFVVLRTRLEDALLCAGLDGYRDYARTVRFRLMPGVW